MMCFADLSQIPQIAICAFFVVLSAAFLLFFLLGLLNRKERAWISSCRGLPGLMVSSRSAASAVKGIPHFCNSSLRLGDLLARISSFITASFLFSILTEKKKNSKEHSAILFQTFCKPFRMV